MSTKNARMIKLLKFLNSHRMIHLERMMLTKKSLFTGLSILSTTYSKWVILKLNFYQMTLTKVQVNLSQKKMSQKENLNLKLKKKN